MNKPTLKQIFDFGLEVVEKEADRIIKGKEYSNLTYSKRYKKEVIIHSCIVWFGYTISEVENYSNMLRSNVRSRKCVVNKSNYKQTLSEELFNSMMYTLNKKHTEELFFTEAQEARDDFITTLKLAPWDNKLRTDSETLIIMYDQMVEKLKQLNK